VTPLPLIDVPRSTLGNFIETLLRWNRTVNLIGRADEGVVWERHIADSLQLAPLVQGAARGIDLGSGAGFPGLILALATGIPFELVEADRRKAAFLREAARVTKAPIQVHATRAESAKLTPAPVITARALAPLPRLLELAAPFLAPGGACVFLKGSHADAELTDAASEWQMQVERFPSRTAPDGVILRLSEIARVRPNP
jgi:16S rRNA (guanine527-N7)-methyltransferase